MSPSPSAGASQATPRQAPGGGFVVFGSTLNAPANVTESSGQDDAFWLTALGPSGAPAAQTTVRAPQDGQVVSLKFKGTATPSGFGAPPLTEIHFLDLSPQPDGAVRVARVSGPTTVPAGGDPQQISTFAPENLCVHRGDYLGLATEGGFDPQSGYPNGVPFRLFSQVSGSVTGNYTKHNDIQLGHRFTGAPLQNVELLVQVAEATGANVGVPCQNALAAEGGGGPDGANIALTLRGNITTGAGGQLLIPLTAPPDTSPTNPANWEACADRPNRPNCPSLGLTGAHTSRVSVAVTAAGRVYGRGSLSTTSPGPTQLTVKPTKFGKRLFRRRASFKVTVHLAFRTSAKLGSSSKTKDFKVKVKGRKGH